MIPDFGENNPAFRLNKWSSRKELSFEVSIFDMFYLAGIYLENWFEVSDLFE
jgi:hypothetical protein